MSSGSVDGSKPYSRASAAATATGTGCSATSSSEQHIHGVLHSGGNSHTNSNENVHVHFPECQTVAHDSDILVEWTSDNLVDVHLGFLQLHRRYQVRFTLREHRCHALGEDLICDPLQNLHVKVASIAPEPDGHGHEITLDLATYKEKLMTEELVIRDPTQNDKQITVKIHARVLGKGKGTPMLKKGIHCTAIEHDEESEMSDWQGFD